MVFHYAFLEGVDVSCAVAYPRPVRGASFSSASAPMPVCNSGNKIKVCRIHLGRYKLSWLSFIWGIIYYQWPAI